MIYEIIKLLGLEKIPPVKPSMLFWVDISGPHEIPCGRWVDHDLEVIIVSFVLL